MLISSELAELKQAFSFIKHRISKIHKSPEFDKLISQSLDAFQTNYLLYAYIRKFCKSTRKKNRQELLIKKILYVIYINRTQCFYGSAPKIDYLDLLVGAEGRDYCADLGLKKDDYLIVDIVGSDFCLKHVWDTKWELKYGYKHSRAEYELYKHGVPEVDLENDIVFSIKDDWL